MDLLKTLFDKIKFLVPVLIGLIFLYFLIALTFSIFGFRPSEYLKTSDFLPSPRKISVYNAPVYANEFNENPYSVPEIISNPSPDYNPEYEKYPNEFFIILPYNSDLRNVYVTGSSKFSSGVLIKGEARKEFFNRARFIISLEDRGQLIMTTIAYAKKDPKTLEWVPFAANVGYIPPTVNKCVLIFQNENYSGNLTNDKTIRVPVLCR